MTSDVSPIVIGINRAADPMALRCQCAVAFASAAGVAMGRAWQRRSFTRAQPALHSSRASRNAPVDSPPWHAPTICE